MRAQHQGQDAQAQGDEAVGQLGQQEQQARNHGYKNLPRGGGGGGSGIDPKTAASYLRQRLQSQNASPGAVAEHKQSAIDYLVNRGVSRKVAQRVVNGYIKRHASKGGRGPTIDWELW